MGTSRNNHQNSFKSFPLSKGGFELVLLFFYEMCGRGARSAIFNRNLDDMLALHSTKILLKVQTHFFPLTFSFLLKSRIYRTGYNVRNKYNTEMRYGTGKDKLKSYDVVKRSDVTVTS